MWHWQNVLFLKKVFDVSQTQQWQNVLVLEKMFDVSQTQQWQNVLVLEKVFDVSQTQQWQNVLFLYEYSKGVWSKSTKWIHYIMNVLNMLGAECKGKTSLYIRSSNVI